SSSLTLRGSAETIAIVPMEKPNALTQKALQTASGLSRTIQILHIKQENSQCDFLSEWNRNVKASIEQAGLPEPELVIVESPYRKVISPILDYIWKLERENADKTI